MHRPLMAATVAALLAAGPTAAQVSQVLDPSLTSANWNTTSAIWGPAVNGGGGPYTTTWGNAAVAGFQNSSNLTVTVAQAVSANGIQYAGTNVSIGGSSAITLSGAGAYILSQNGGLTHTISAPLAGSNGLIVYGTGGGASTTINLNGANTYTGQTWFRNGFTGPATVKAGVATSGSSGALGSSTNSLFMESTTTTLDLNGFAVGVGGLTGSGTVTNSGSTATFTAGNDNTSTSFSGSLTGSLGLTKAGSGTLTLSGTSNSYSGGTTVSAGTLSVTNSSGSGTGTGSVTINGTGTLTGTGTISGSVSATAGSIGAGTIGTAGNLTLQNGLTLASGVQFKVDITGTAAGTGYDQIDLTSGTATLAGATLSFGTLSGSGYTAGTRYIILDTVNGGISGTFNGQANGSTVTALANFGGFASWNIFYDNAVGEVYLTPVPEPGMVLGLAAAGLGLARVVRRRRAGGVGACGSVSQAVIP